MDPHERRRPAVVVAATIGAAVLVVVTAGFMATRGTEDATPTEVGTGTTEWPGPIRPGAGQAFASGLDRRDVEFGAIDIVRVSSGGYRRDEWTLTLRERPPRASSVDRTQTVIEYGVVVDAEEDGIPDCHIAISDDAPDGFRVTVRNLRTGNVDEQVGPPYGVPIDFVHPDEERGSRTMKFFFLMGPRDCDLYVPASYYAYASLTRDGRVIAWDYAPDTGWVEMP